VIDSANGDLLTQELLAATPFRTITLTIFILAILHTLFANHLALLAEHVANKHAKKDVEEGRKKTVSFGAELLHFLGEVEVAFALWAFPLFFTIVGYYSFDAALGYLNTRTYVEPLFVVVVMAIAATRPVLRIAEGGLWLISQAFGGTVGAWWMSILTLGPILGSFITEVGAMTICALILMNRFYQYGPSKKLAYATLGLLFVNISVGGLLTNFASPPVLIVARIWDWSSTYMFLHFGWKSILGILIANTCYFLYFRKEIKSLDHVKKEKEKTHPQETFHPVPFWITGVHFLFLIWIVCSSHYPVVFIGAFLIFLGFHQATRTYQSELYLKRPLLVGMFLAGLIIHGGLQGWWIVPILQDASEGMMMLVGMILTPFNDNAAIVYLVSLTPNLAESLKLAIMGGVVAGGGLTVIANAPNPAGQSILKKYFRRGISPINLFLAALIPTAILMCLFYFI